MKGKRFEKKLVLNKSLVARLTGEGMDQVKGGLPPTWFTACLYTCTGQPCYGWETYEFRGCEDLTQTACL